MHGPFSVPTNLSAFQFFIPSSQFPYLKVFHGDANLKEGATIELKGVWPRWKKQTAKKKAKLTPKQANKDVINLQENEKEEEKALLNGLIMSKL